MHDALGGTVILTTLALALAVDGWFGGPTAAEAGRYCYDGRVTGYVRTDHGSHTYDGTPITTPEPIAAAGWDIPIDSLVEVSGVGTYRVADRGLLGPGHVDVAVWTSADAFAITGWRTICVMRPVAGP